MRRVLPLLLLAALLVPALPSHAAGCTSGLPVTDGHAAIHSCPGVHPGMALKVHSAKYGDLTCTASYAFADSTNTKYLSLPGTCFLDFDCLEDLFQPYPPPLDQPPLSDLVPPPPTCTFPSDSELEPYYRKGTGPIIRDGNGTRIGRLAYAVNKHGIDFALVRLDPAVKVDPALPIYGGPLRAEPIGLAPVAGYVYSAPPQSTQPNASSALLYATDAGQAWAYTGQWSETLRGGSAMTEDGNAVGLLTGTLYVGEGLDVQPLGPATAHLAQHVGLHVRLLTAPLA